MENLNEFHFPSILGGLHSDCCWQVLRHEATLPACGQNAVLHSKYRTLHLIMQCGFCVKAFIDI